VIWDESSAEAVAKLRAMNEAGNVTWDLVDVVAADAIRLCDEGLAMEIDHDEMLAAAPDGTPASEDFGDLLVGDCFIPQIVYSTTFGYRTDMVADTPPTDICDVFDLETSRASARWKSARSTTWNGLCSATVSPRTTSMTCWKPKKVRPRRLPSSTPSRTRDLVVCRRRHAAASRRRRSRHGLDLQRPSVLA
jgi:spermidine/putrescine-binding protein